MTLKQTINRIEIKIEQLILKEKNKYKVKKIELNMNEYESRMKQGNYNYAIVQIHIGLKPIPNYAESCIRQIRLQDSKIPIYFVCSRKNDTSAISQYCNVIYEEDLVVSEEHLEFLKKISKMNMTNFFQVTIERFFFLYDAMITLGLENILHLENDNLIYVNATELMIKLEKIYNRIATPRASKEMCCASLMYVPGQNALKDFLNYINRDSGDIYFNDMALLPAHIDAGRGDTLPTFTKKYFEINGLKRANGEKVGKDENGKEYYNHSQELKGIFDCACIGQYIDGCDRKYHPDKTAGFVNQESYLDPRKICIQWEKSEDGLVRPYIYESDEKYLAFNLHIHSKKLEKFMSNNENLI